MKALSKYELNWWSNNISVAYSAYKDRVRRNTKVSYDDLNEQLMPILMKALNDVVYGKLRQASNLSEGVWITIGMNDVAGLVPEGFKELYLERSEQHCKDIRVKCDPVREQRDKFLVRLYSRPTEEDLEEINKWIYQINHTEEVGGCEL